MNGYLHAGRLDRPASLLVCRPQAGGGWAWEEERRIWIHAEFRPGSNIFSKWGMGARDVTVVLWWQAICLHNALLVEGTHLLLTSVTDRNRNQLELRAAACQVSTLTASLQRVEGRDALNRPVAGEGASFPFPGVLTELYYRNLPEELYREEVQGRCLVTPKAVRLRTGDLVREGAAMPWTVRRVLDLDPYKNEYIIERQGDV